MVKQRRKKRRRLSPEERKKAAAERKFRRMVAGVFTGAGFEQIPVRGVHFSFQDRKGEIDSLFVHRNIIVVCEETMDSGVRDHLNKTGVLFKHLAAHQTAFVEALPSLFPEWKARIKEPLAPREYLVRYLYCSRNLVQPQHLAAFTEIKCLQYPGLRYFSALVKVIQQSSRFELFKFLGLGLSDLTTEPGRETKEYSGFLLPDLPSGFPVGYRILTFYMDPRTLMERCYVFRKDSWEDKESLYQRMLIKNKIRSMRAYLCTEGRTFVNNVIVSLPPEVSVPEQTSNTRSQTVTLRIPSDFNRIGLVDGQHRVFAYHEGNDQYEVDIRPKRDKQQLLVTGVLFPEGASLEDRTKFEARLFLEINDKQSRTRGDLRQAIYTIVEPFGAIAIAKSVVSALARQGPLEGLLEDHYFGEGSVKTTSIVSYGLQHVVRFDATQEHSFFRRWTDAKQRDDLIQRKPEARAAYVDFCAGEINKLFGAFRVEINARGLWTTDKKASRALTTTTINGLIYCLRLLIVADSLQSFDWYRERFKRLTIDFKPGKFGFRSSHWRALGERLFKECFQ